MQALLQDIAHLGEQITTRNLFPLDVTHLAGSYKRQ